MNLFLVALDDDNSDPDVVDTAISEHYEDTHFRLSHLTWVVASQEAPAEIGSKLGIDARVPEGRAVSGMVALIEDYSGYASKSLWQVMRRWAEI